MFAGLALTATAVEATKAPKTTKEQAAFSWVSPLAKNETAKKSLPAAVTHATFLSPSMGLAVGYDIYLPPGYDTAPERYPVVYHLHGGRPGGEGQSVRLADYVDRALAAGKIKPAIYVFPNGGLGRHPMFQLPVQPQVLRLSQIARRGAHVSRHPRCRAHRHRQLR
jgi:endo-1,4-beta-xylanase